ncbi:MAG: hypothetical protein E7430_06475 [Ruminococcaceae bacterium]|nr:hypothetical protein [Oscillospiraceae bacterium]
MEEKIYTIPINEAFDKKCGCPLCSLAADLEKSSLEYIMGAAMMEPDVRIETNRLGFCRSHYDKMSAMKNRLSLALMLESRLPAVRERVVPSEIKTGKLSKFKKNDSDDSGLRVQAAASGCYVCSRAAMFEKQYVSNLIYMYKKDEAFREKLRLQEYFCLTHFGKLLQAGKEELNEALYARFSADLHKLQDSYFDRVTDAVTAFCRSFDHQNAGKPLTEEQISAVSDAIDFLAGK